MKNRYNALRFFQSSGAGDLRLGVVFFFLIILCAGVAVLALSAVSAHFAYASVKTVPIPPKRPNVLSASPAYIRQLLARDDESYVGAETDTNTYDDSQMHHEAYEEYDQTEDGYDAGVELASLEDVDSYNVMAALDSSAVSESDYSYGVQSHSADEIEDSKGVIYYESSITGSGVPVPGHKPAYGDKSLVQRVEDFSTYPSSVKMSEIAPEAGSSEQQTADLKEPEIQPVSSGIVLQPIMVPEPSESETALVSFTLEPDQVSLDPALKTFLLEHAVQMFKDDPNLRLEIHAYASAQDGQAYSDVRRSLARALEVRRFLLEQNIDPSRLKLTPLGRDVEETTDNRIDLLFIASR